jgi:acyl-CoA hydrolase
LSEAPGITPKSRRIEDSRVEMAELVMPGDANAIGTVFGGRVMYLIDQAAAMSAIRHCRTIAVTASVDSIDFHSPVKIADIMILHARVTQVFSSSFEVRVDVYGENPGTGRRVLTTTAFATMVSIGPDGRPQRAPSLVLETEADRAEAKAAEGRRALRLARRRD